MYIQDINEVMDIANILQTAAAVLMPILAVVFKIYTDKQKLETQAIISESKAEVIGLMERNKTEVAEQLTKINTQLTVNVTEDKGRDKELKRLNVEIEKLKI